MARRSSRTVVGKPEPKPCPWTAAREGLSKLQYRTVAALVPLEFDPMDLARSIYPEEYLRALANVWKFAVKDLYYSNTFFSIPEADVGTMVWLGWRAFNMVPPDPTAVRDRQVVHEPTVTMVKRVEEIHRGFETAEEVVSWFEQFDDIRGALHAWPQLVGLIGEERWGSPRPPRYPLSEILGRLRMSSRVISSALILPEPKHVSDREAELGIRVGAFTYHFRREGVAE